MKNTGYLIFVTLIIVTFTIANSCNSDRKQKEADTVVQDSAVALSGEQLFQLNCQGCHLLPDPKRLPKNVWEHGVMPLMGLRMGLKNTNYERVISAEERKIEDDNNLIPSEPMLSDQDFETIKRYIISVAPENVSYANYRVGRAKEITQFTRKNIPIPSAGPSFITALRYNAKEKLLWIGNVYNQVLKWKWGKGVVATEEVTAAVVDFNFYNNKTYFTQIGTLAPSELSKGLITQSDRNSNPILTQLHRPVFSITEDLDNDGIPEVIVGNFGKNLGSLSLYSKSKANKPYQELKLLAVPGVVSSYVRDMNKDGLKDIVALFSQADETVYIFFQKENLTFEAHRVLRFPPDYGTTDMILEDYNKDGLVDIITVNGDNADYSQVLKDYHGLRIHINEGDNKFKEKFFYPAYGATRVIAHDFDKDGDLDIAISCFYPDYGQLISESFIYLQNDDAKTYRFTAYTHQSDLPVKSLALQKGDIDNDGDMDIIMGNCASSPVRVPEELDQQWKQAKYGLVVFLNNLN